LRSDFPGSSRKLHLGARPGRVRRTIESGDFRVKMVERRPILIGPRFTFPVISTGLTIRVKDYRLAQ